MSAAHHHTAALLEQALDIYRHPLRYRKRWADPGYALPEGVGGLLDLALGPAETLDSHAARLHASGDELASAIHFFIRQVLLAEGNDAYRMLGLAPGADPAQVKSHYRKLMRLYHPDRHPGDEWSEIYAPRVNQAYGILRGAEPPPARRESPSAPRRQPARQETGSGQETRRFPAAPLKSFAARRRKAPGRLRGYGAALSGGAVAAGLGFIVWNMLEWPAPAELAGPLAEEAAASAEFAAPAPEEIPARPSAAGPPARKIPAPKAGVAATAAPTPAGTPESRPAPAGLSERELKAQVLDRLAAAYRQGDLPALVALFSEHAVTNSQAGREGIRGEYARLFANSRRRELRLGRFRWQITDQTAIGTGTFNLTVDAIEQNTQSSYAGTLTLDVGQGPQGPLINGFFQSRREPP